MAFSLPNFNLTVDIWLPPNQPVTGGPDQTARCQMYLLSRTDIEITPSTVQHFVPPVIFRFQPDFYTQVGPASGLIFGVQDLVNAKVWYYVARWWDNIHLGFPNQYTIVLCEQCDAAGFTPDPGRIF